MRFAGKVVLVTGGGSGIGKATAIAFAREGAHVVVVDWNEETAQAVAGAIAAQGGQASAFRADVSQYDQCDAMVEHAMRTYGGLHVAFNNAGIGSALNANFTDVSVEEWQRVTAVNYSGIFFSMKAEVPALRRSGGKVIVNTASSASFLAVPAMPAYVGSKHAVAGLTKAAALDLIGEGIRVNAVCPGFTDTGMMSKAIDEEARAASLAHVPIKRSADPAEIAEVVLFLASDAAAYMVGSLVRVDGGLTVP